MVEADDEATAAKTALASLAALCAELSTAHVLSNADMDRFTREVDAATAALRAAVTASAVNRLARALERAGLSDRFTPACTGILSVDAITRIEELSEQAAIARSNLARVAEAVTRALTLHDYGRIAAEGTTGAAAQGDLDLAIRQIEELLDMVPAAPRAPSSKDAPFAPPSNEASGATPAAITVPQEPAAPNIGTNAAAASGGAEVSTAPHAIVSTMATSVEPEVLQTAAATTAAPEASEPSLIRQDEIPQAKIPSPVPASGSSEIETLADESAEDSVLSAVLQALSSERLGLAEALCEVSEDIDVPPTLRAAIPLAAMALVADGSGMLDDRVREATQRAVDELRDADDTVATKIGVALLLPSAINLALLAPGADQTDLLNVLLDGRREEDAFSASFPALRDLARTTQSARISGATMMPASSILSSLLTEDAWREQLDMASAATKDWRRAQLSRTIKFSGASDVWHRIIRNDFAPSLEIAASGDAGRAAEVLDFVSNLDPLKLIRDTEVKVRSSMAARRSPIHSDALRKLEECLDEGTRMLRNWATLAQGTPSRGQTNRARPLVQQRTEMLTRIDKAAREIETLADQWHDAIPITTRLLDRLGNLWAGKPPAGEERSLDAFLGRDLASFSQVRFGPGWLRQRPLRRELRDDLRRLASTQPPPAVEAVQRRIDSGNFAGAALAIELVPDDKARGGLQRLLGQAMERRKAEIVKSLEAQRAAVEDADRAGRIETGEAQERLEGLRRAHEAIEQAAPDTLEEMAADADQDIRETQAKLAQGRQDARERIQGRFAQIKLPDESSRERIERLLEAEQFALAEDLVDQLEAGEHIEARPTPAVQEAFAGFFPERAARLAEWLRRRTATMPEIAAGRAVEWPSAILNSGETLPDDLPKLAQAWFDCVRENGRTQLKDALVRLLTALGFTDPQLVGYATPPKNATEFRGKLQVRSLRDRDTAVLPNFGSDANGSYTLLCLWQKRDAEDVTQALAALRDGGQPTIVLFFAPLDNTQRGRLAALARADRLRTTIVVDEVLALHLGMLQRQRLMALFACTLPFTDCRPWADTGTPAPEMFFGRARELRAIEERSGDFTHLIYGGRQLGKTALLRHVERASTERPDIIARYISIAEFGQQRPHTALWQRLGEELAHAKLQIAQPHSDKNVRAAIRAWLDGRPNRRLLLLLDEADAFFEKDREDEFSVTTVLRDLTVETDRRFKPVFAGLRNVQKLARDPNSPIAHLGMPLVVGPMLRGEERREAEHLVRWPFAALGYRLDDAVVSRILTFANYYPSLIQVVCQRLLRDLRQRGGGVPPWQVQIEHVERVLEMPELRNAAFERFRITLELDQRYKLMTLVVANFSMGEPQLLASGIDRSTLRDLAAAAWPAGFSPSFSDDAFDALLDEMVGLGLLRGVGGAHFALRSANLAHLIGRPAEIRQQIEDFAGRPAPARHDPLEMRRQVDGRPGLLTTRQEGHLLAPGGVVAVIAGAALAGIDRWKAAIEATCLSTQGHGRERVIPRLLPKPHTMDALRDALAVRGDAGNYLYIVPPEAPWDATWVKLAHQRRATRSTSPIRVVFVADAARAARWVAHSERAAVLDDGGSTARVIEMTVGRLGQADIDQWDGPQNLGQTGEWIVAATGGWDALIRRLEGLNRSERAGANAAEMAGRLAQSGGGAISDVLAALPQMERVLSALRECADTRINDEVVDAATIAAYLETQEEDAARALALGEMLALIERGQHGLSLNEHAARALPSAPNST